ncbi:MAG: GNAT family N-acetyltransferase [Oscillospiraceae bacterium]|jgi:RimJ/RimL family protein N-acetyltransferase|nr:GNAT family N-acetyltransferase [Oscillospiraceae bacterium]
MKYFKKLVGEHIYLSPVNPDDAEIYTKWLNDPEVTDWISQTARIFSLSAERKVLEKMADEGGYIFAIVRLSDDALLGNCGIHDIIHTNRRATVGIFIGEAENRSRGYGSEALRLLLGYGFNTLNLHNIMLTVQSDNARAIRCYEKIGFREYGHRRESVFKNGGYVDSMYMDILENEYREMIPG